MKQTPKDMGQPMAPADQHQAASDLDTLDAMTAAIDAEHHGTAPDGTVIADQPAPTNYAMEAAGTVDMFGALVTGYCPAAGDLWSSDKKASIAAALAPVMEKYSFTLGAMPCELVLIITAGPVLYQTSKIIATQMAADKAKAAQAKTTAQATPGGNTSAQQLDPAAKGVAESPEVLRHPQTALYK